MVHRIRRQSFERDFWVYYTYKLTAEVQLLTIIELQLFEQYQVIFKKLNPQKLTAELLFNKYTHCYYKLQTQLKHMSFLSFNISLHFPLQVTLLFMSSLFWSITLQWKKKPVVELPMLRSSYCFAWPNMLNILYCNCWIFFSTRIRDDQLYEDVIKKSNTATKR